MTGDGQRRQLQLELDVDFQHVDGEWVARIETGLEGRGATQQEAVDRLQAEMQARVDEVMADPESRRRFYQLLDILTRADLEGGTAGPGAYGT